MMLRVMTVLCMLGVLMYGSQMKCAPGKCGGGASAMKCAPGKCGGGSDSKAAEKTTHLKPYPEAIVQHFNLKTVPVVRRTVGVSKRYYGYVRADESKTFQVTVRFGGYVEVLYADTTYRYVKKGQKLAKVYSPEVYKAKKEFLNALLYHTKNPSKEMLRSARIKLELLGVPDQEIDRILKHRKISRYTTIYSDYEGYIFAKRISQGGAFKAMESLFEIVDLRSLWVEASIYSKEIDLISSFDRFEIIAPDGGRYSAKKGVLYPRIDTKDDTAIVRLHLNNREGDRLYPGMYVDISAKQKRMPRLVIPQTAVAHKGKHAYVFLATEFEGIYRPVLVKVKALGEGLYEVLSGLEEGDEVVSEALFLLDSDAQFSGISGKE